MDSTDERGTRAEWFEVFDSSLILGSSDVADPQAGLTINASWRSHSSLRSMTGTEWTGSCVADSMVEEGEASDPFEVPGTGPLRRSSDVAESLESMIAMFGDQGNSLQSNLKTEGVGRCDRVPLGAADEASELLTLKLRRRDFDLSLVGEQLAGNGSFGVSSVMSSQKSSGAGGEWVSLSLVKTHRVEGISSWTSIDVEGSDSFEVCSADLPRGCSDIGDELGGLVVGMCRANRSFEVLGAFPT